MWIAGSDRMCLAPSGTASGVSSAAEGGGQVWSVEYATTEYAAASLGEFAALARLDFVRPRLTRF